MTRGRLVRDTDGWRSAHIFRRALNARHYERILFGLTHGLGYLLYDSIAVPLGCLKGFR